MDHHPGLIAGQSHGQLPDHFRGSVAGGRHFVPHGCPPVRQGLDSSTAIPYFLSQRYKDQVAVSTKNCLRRWSIWAADMLLCFSRASKMAAVCGAGNICPGRAPGLEDCSYCRPPYVSVTFTVPTTGTASAAIDTTAVSPFTVKEL